MNVVWNDKMILRTSKADPWRRPCLCLPSYTHSSDIQLPPTHKFRYCRFLLRFIVLFVKHRCLKVAKTRPRLLPYWAQQSVSVTSWTRPAFVASLSILNHWRAEQALLHWFKKNNNCKPTDCALGSLSWKQKSTSLVNKNKKSWINDQIQYEDENGSVHGFYVFRF